MKLVLSVLVIFASSFAFAYIPRGLLILEKTTDNNGSGAYQIEQEVQFPNNQDVLILKETWLVENENTLRVTVTGTKDLKDQIQFSISYTGGTRSGFDGGSKITTDFIERYFHFRKSENFANALIQLKIVPGTFMNKKPVRTTKEVEHSPENYVRLSRNGGAVTYALGTPTPAGQSSENPGFWIEQDNFVLKKFRLPSQVEVSADKYSIFSRGLHFPRTRTVQWNSNQVTIQTLSVTGKGKDVFAQTTKPQTNLNGLKGQAAQSLVEEFYKRFR